MIDSETTSRIHDPEHPNNGTISVRVLFTMPTLCGEGSVHVYGIFRLDDDAEVDWTTLSLEDKKTLEDACVESTKIKN